MTNQPTPPQITKEEFAEICRRIRQDSDFMDPTYIYADDFNPLDPDDIVILANDLTMNYGGLIGGRAHRNPEFNEARAKTKAVLNFLRTRYGIDLVEGGSLHVDNPDWSLLVSSWYEMYEDERNYRIGLQGMLKNIEDLYVGAITQYGKGGQVITHEEFDPDGSSKGRTINPHKFDPTEVSLFTQCRCGEPGKSPFHI